ncbi:MAG: hypothetical protein A3F16_05570 [Deltaproteobacteria bacterium RIFCSPHIGHO2_12_FULL_43_9]|nr:MAG: hypothetical protein A3F16_05570 [Deltaproteobacteria bacterium RIFCSPHIGHO2_12_FULL_43_9]
MFQNKLSLGALFLVLLCAISFPLHGGEGTEIATCEVAPNNERGILGDTVDFMGNVLGGTADVAGSLFLGDEFSKDAKLGEGDTVFDFAYIFMIAALANYRTLGNLIFMFSYNSALNDSSDIAKDVIHGKVSQKKLDQRQKSLAKAENTYLPLWNSQEVKSIADFLVYKGIPWLTDSSVPVPPLETYYNVDEGDQYIGVKRNPAATTGEKKSVGDKKPAFSPY